MGLVIDRLVAWVEAKKIAAEKEHARRLAAYFAKHPDRRF